MNEFKTLDIDIPKKTKYKQAKYNRKAKTNKSRQALFMLLLHSQIRSP